LTVKTKTIYHISAMANNFQVKEIGKNLADTSKPLKERFRALFTLKNIGGKEAIDFIANSFTDSSALLKHELAYCLGQMQDPYAIPKLIKVLENEEQEPMVRHEAGIYFLSDARMKVTVFLYISRNPGHFAP
jgi:deoxyhypusine monooxygenase